MTPLKGINKATLVADNDFNVKLAKDRCLNTEVPVISCTCQKNPSVHLEIY